MTAGEIRVVNPLYLRAPLDELEDKDIITSHYIERTKGHFIYIYRICDKYAAKKAGLDSSTAIEHPYDHAWATFRDNCKNRSITVNPLTYHCYIKTSFPDLCTCRDNCPLKGEIK